MKLINFKMKIFIFFLFFIHTSLLFSGAVFQGEGTADNPFLIRTGNDLKKLSDNSSYWSKHFKQISDISMDNISDFTPIGNSTISFRGTYNGDNHSVSGLTINLPDRDFVGLFGYIDNATIKNIGITGDNITGKNYVGAIAGFAKNSLISFVYNIGYLSGDNYIGGIAGGIFDNTTITEIYSETEVKGKENVGGIAGIIKFCSNIEKIYNNSTIKGTVNVGGLTGKNSYFSNIFYAYSTGKITGDNITGGLTGINQKSLIYYSYSSSTVNGNDYIGGIVGKNDNSSYIVYTYCYGEITGKNASEIGGLTGKNFDNDTIVNSFWDTENTGQSSNEGGTGKTPDEIKDDSILDDILNNFEKKDFDFVTVKDNFIPDKIWENNENINSGYPFIHYVTPDKFTFPEKTDVEIDSTVESDNITVENLSVPLAKISLTKGEFRVFYDNNSLYKDWRNDNSTYVRNGYKIQVRLVSSSEYNSKTETTLTINQTSASFSVVTKSNSSSGSTQSNTSNSSGGNKNTEDEDEIGIDQLKDSDMATFFEDKIELDFNKPDSNSLNLSIDLSDSNLPIEVKDFKIPANTTIKGGEVIGGAIGNIDLDNTPLDKAMSKLPTLESVKLTPKNGVIKLEKTVLKDVDFNVQNINEISFGEGVVFDKATLNNLANEFSDSISLVSAVPEAKTDTGKIKSENLPSPDFPLIEENGNKKTLTDIINNSLGNNLFQVSSENGLLKISSGGITYKFTIKDVAIVSLNNNFSENENISILADGGIEITDIENNLKIKVYPAPYNINELDEILSSVDNMEFVFKSNGTIEVTWFSEDYDATLISSFILNGNYTETEKKGSSELEVIDENIVKILYKDGIEETLAPGFIGMESLSSFLNGLKEENSISSWSLNRKTGELQISYNDKILKIIPEIYGIQTNKTENNETSIKIEKFQDKYVLITPESIQIVNIIQPEE